MAITASDFLIRPVMQSTTGLPEDVFVNDFAFKWTGGGVPDAGDFGAICAAVGDFYRQGAAEGDRVGSYMGTAVDRAATHEIQVFSILTGGSAVYEEAWLGPVAVLGGGGGNMPLEVAAVLSFHADLTGVSEEAGATRPRGRRRGRVYIGPLRGAALTVNDDQPELAGAFRTALQANAIVMADDALAAGWTWSVWSRVDATLRTVVGGWTDNAPDTQRRRGQAATQRSTFGPVGP